MDFLKRFSLQLCFSLSLLFGCLPAEAAPGIEDYGALPAVQMMAVSPDGTLIAFRQQSGTRDIIAVYSLEKSKLLRALDISEIKPHHLYFLDKSRLVMVASEDRRLLGYRDSHEISTAFLLNVDTGEIGQLLTPGDVIFKGQSGLGSIVGASRDSEHVFMPAFVGDSRHDQSPDFSLMKVDLDSLRRPKVVEKGSSSTVDYFVDDDGNPIAEEIFSNHFDYHAIVAHRGKEEVEIYRMKTEVPHIGVVGVTPDRKALVILDESEATGRVAYHTMSLADGKISAPIFERSDADIERVLTDLNRVVYGVIYSGLRPSYEFFDIALNTRMSKILAEYPRHSVWLADWSPDWQHLIIKIEGAGSAGEYFLNSKGNSSRFLASARPTISAEYFNPVVEFEYKARDGLTIPTLITVPAANADNLKKLPAVMLPHGGPEAHDWMGFDWFAQALASRGYLVIQPQFRGSSGFGLDHLMAGYGEWGKKMQDDLTDALAALVAQELVDPERVCIAGMSYGGYAALAGGSFTPDLYQCVVAINGVSDLRKMLGYEKAEHNSNHWIVAYFENSMTDGEDGKDRLDAVSPARHAGNFTAPVLLVHGERDTTVPIEQAKYMHKQLKRSEKPVEFIELNDEDHQLSQPSTRLKTLEATIRFIDEHIGQKTVTANLDGA
jgi:dipeptidyl aminopeptidase/acylaminoacyl peptidase